MRDEHAAGRRRHPHRAGVAGRSRDGSDKPSGAGRAAIGRHSQISIPGRTDANKVTAAGLCSRCRELGAVGLEVRLIPAPVLRAPDTLRALENRPRTGRIWISDDRRIEVRSFRAARYWRGDNDPLQRIAIPEIGIMVLTEERIEPHGDEFVTLKPDWPPSPYMICGQTTADPVVSNVPLSCVPP